ncbi:MAG: class B sortase, partial [Clostridiales Family XIII bacterium]|nr:class B sortase [Clostridiales Family XIII bacterium]
ADRAAEKDFEQLLPAEIANDAGGSGGGSLTYADMLPYYEGLRAKNGDMAGWLRIPGTRISYPVMQTKKSPEYYLDKNFEKEYSASGSLFAADISDVNLPTDVVTIYGHRMKTGAMFGSLGDFLDVDFLQKHETIIFDTFTARNEYKIYCLFSLAVGTGEESEFAYYNYSRFEDKATFDDFMAQARKVSQVENPSFAPIFGEKILLLSTCEYTHENGRLVIVAVQTSSEKR